MDPKTTLQENLELIRALATRQCFKYHLSREEVEDFTQEVIAKLLRDDYAILGQYHERCKLPTYLAMVISTALRDHVNHLWGKWRSSAAAKALGQDAVALERLVVRDHWSFDEACQILRNDPKIHLDEAALAELAEKLPLHRQRWGRNRLDSGCDAAGRAAAGMSAPGHPLATVPESAEETLLRLERAPRLHKAVTALRQALTTLPAEDQLILKLKIESDFTVAQIARALALDQKPLYTRLPKILGRLRQELERRGIDPEDIRDILRDASS
jgi:RNA polymerase sigma factor (sigma-70 family)